MIHATPALRRQRAALLVGSLMLWGCAGTASESRSPQIDIAEACAEAARLGADPAPCDRFVAQAQQHGNKVEVFRAYSYRSLLWAERGDMKAAMADAELANEAVPELKYGQYWRLVLIGQSGDYATALNQIRHLEYQETHTEFHADIAMLEYVAGDRARSAAFFRQAALYASDIDHDQDMAAYYRFNAAIVDSELKNNDLAPLRALRVNPNTLAGVLKAYRVGDISDAELIAKTDDPRSRNACSAYFSIGHMSVLNGNEASAKSAFESAIARCSTTTFEHHAAKKWLKQLGA
jgi:tetratricopeptide (TPR) repeat protein